MTAFKQLITPAITDLIVEAGGDLLNSTKFKCRKVSYHSPAAAKKALKVHGYRIGCKAFYKCGNHGTLEIYHLTSMKTHNKRDKDMELPTEREINDCLNWCSDAENDGTNYHGMSYEQGVRDAIEWLQGDAEHGPHEGS